MYSIRAYHSTGFNAVNLPDSPALLNSGLFTYTDFPALDIMQNRFLQSVRIRGSWSQVKDIDYINIFDGADVFYYAVTGIAMTSLDVCTLELVPDFITTAGGIDVIVPMLLDGVVERCHVSDDTYGKWGLDDELLVNARPLLLDVQKISFSNSTIDVIAGTIDFGLMANLAGAYMYVADQDEYVNVPRSFPARFPATYSLDGHSSATERLALYPISDNAIRNGVEQARALGVESAAVGTAMIPSALVTATQSTESVSQGAAGTMRKNVTCGSLTYTVLAEFSKESGDTIAQSWGIYTQMTGTFATRDTGFSFVYDSTVKNKRLLYGGLNRVGILTTAGNRLESKPEELTGGSRTSIHIKSVGDPHINGKPYHRFEYMNGDATNAGFWLNAVTGLPWKKIPLMYTEKSGNVLDRISLQNAREVKDMDYGLSSAGIMDMVAEGLSISQGEDIGKGSLLATAIGGIKGLVGGGFTGQGVVSGAFNAAMDYERAYQSYSIARRQELQQFAISQAAVSPSISFPYDGEAFRDFYGETVIAYRYRIDPADLARLDRALTMYGYKTGISPSELNMHNRTYFNYLRGNFSVGGTLPRWLNDGIGTQLSGGARFWHVKPDPAKYADNPVYTPPTP